MSTSTSTDFTILTALEAELGESRVRAMASTYLADCRARDMLVLSPYPSPQMTPMWTTPVVPPLWMSIDGVPTTPPPRRPELLMPPGAPRRPSRSAAVTYSPVLSPVPSSLSPSSSISSTGTMIAPLQDDEDEVAAAAGGHHPDLEDSCPRHSHAARYGLGPSKNASGQWSMYTPLGNGCGNCKADADEEKAISDLYTILEVAQAGDGAAVQEGVRALDAFRKANPYLLRMDLDILDKEFKALVNGE